jgi:hypothetical protein
VGGGRRKVSDSRSESQHGRQVELVGRGVRSISASQDCKEKKRRGLPSLDRYSHLASVPVPVPHPRVPRR